MQGNELKEIQGSCLRLAYLIQKNFDARDDDLEETYKEVIDELFNTTSMTMKWLNENCKVTI